MPDYRLPAPPPDDLAPVLPWELFMSHVFRWRQDEHVAIIGPTDQGKSNLAYHLLELRAYVAYLGIKSRDKTLDAFAHGGGYLRSYGWPAQKSPRWMYKPYTWEQAPRRLVWPDARNRVGSRAVQRRVFGSCLDDTWESGGVCVVWDDFWYIVRILGMELDAKQNLLNARSNDSPQMIIAQRGAGNRMVELFDQPAWLAFARETDPRNLQLLGPASSPRRGFVANLQRHQFLFENTREGTMYRTKAPLLGQAA